MLARVKVPITLGAVPVLIVFVPCQLFLGVENKIAVIIFMIIGVVAHVFVVGAIEISVFTRPMSRSKFCSTNLQYWFHHKHTVLTRPVF